MASARSLLFVALAVLCAGAHAGAVCDNALELEVTPSKSTYRLAEGIPVRVTVVNRLLPPGGDPCVIPPSFVLEREPNSAAYFLVRVTLVKPDGATVLSPRKPEFAIPIRPSLAQFRLLAPGSFVGVTLWLQSVPLGLPVDQAGRYSVRVEVTSDAQSWVRQRIAGDKDLAKDFLYPIDAVFQGSLHGSASFVVE